MKSLINKCARLITLEELVEGKKRTYQFMPAGQAVPVTDSVASAPYTKALIDDGSLSFVDGDASSPDDDLSDLKAQAEDLGITVDKRWGKDRLSDEIEKALEK